VHGLGVCLALAAFGMLTRAFLVGCLVVRPFCLLVVVGWWAGGIGAGLGWLVGWLGCVGVVATGVVG
jgi:hypothetical protein